MILPILLLSLAFAVVESQRAKFSYPTKNDIWYTTSSGVGNEGFDYSPHFALSFVDSRKGVSLSNDDKVTIGLYASKWFSFSPVVEQTFTVGQIRRDEKVAFKFKKMDAAISTGKYYLKASLVSAKGKKGRRTLAKSKSFKVVSIGIQSDVRRVHRIVNHVQATPVSNAAYGLRDGLKVDIDFGRALKPGRKFLVELIDAKTGKRLQKRKTRVPANPQSYGHITLNMDIPKTAATYVVNVRSGGVFSRNKVIFVSRPFTIDLTPMTATLSPSQSMKQVTFSDHVSSDEDEVIDVIGFPSISSSSTPSDSKPKKRYSESQRRYRQKRKRAQKKRKSLETKLNGGSVSPQEFAIAALADAELALGKDASELTDQELSQLEEDLTKVIEQMSSREAPSSSPGSAFGFDEEGSAESSFRASPVLNVSRKSSFSVEDETPKGKKSKKISDEYEARLIDTGVDALINMEKYLSKDKPNTKVVSNAIRSLKATDEDLAAYALKKMKKIERQVTATRLAEGLNSK